jgi:hypothetical protein
MSKRSPVGSTVVLTVDVLEDRCLLSGMALVPAPVQAAALSLAAPVPQGGVLWDPVRNPGAPATTASGPGTPFNPNGPEPYRLPTATPVAPAPPAPASGPLPTPQGAGAGTALAQNGGDRVAPGNPPAPPPGPAAPQPGPAVPPAGVNPKTTTAPKPDPLLEAIDALNKQLHELNQKIDKLLEQKPDIIDRFWYPENWDIWEAELARLQKERGDLIEKLAEKVKQLQDRKP